jgi:hypothetical protein
MNGLILYIDPGTGSMLFTIIIGAVSAGFFVLQKLKLKLKFVLSGGKAQAADLDKIPFVIFSDNKRYWNVFKPICDEFEKREVDLHYLTLDPKDPALTADYKYIHPEFIGEGNKGIAKMNLLKADMVLSTTPSLDVFQWKRSKNVKYYVHCLHAANDPASYRMFGLDFYDSVLLSGKYQEEEIREIEKMREIPRKELVMVGIPYMDTMKERLMASTPHKMETNVPTVIMAPSWGSNSLLNMYGASLINKLLDSNYKVIIRPHPQSYTSEKDLIDGLMAEFPDSDNLQWNRDPDNFEVLNKSDILISDFSGILFDYSLVFNKPIIYSIPEFDKSQYDFSWLDDDMAWTFNVLPKLGKELTKNNFDNIVELIDDCLNGASASDLAKERDLAREQTWYDIGNGAKNVTDYLLAKHKAISIHHQSH